MKFIDPKDPEILEMKRGGGGCFVIFGLPFFLVGLFIICLSLGLIPEKGEGFPWYVGIPFGGVFASLGAAFIFGRSGIIIDKRRNSIVSWWGLIVAFKRTENTLAHFERIALDREVRRGEKKSYTVYPVRLASTKVDTEPVNIDEPKEYQQARQIAEKIAKFLELPLADSSTGTEVVREADKLDESIRDRARRLGETVVIPSPPSAMRSTVRKEYASVTVEIPPLGLMLNHYIILVGLSVFLVMAVISGITTVYSIIKGSETDFILILVPCLFFLIPIAVIFQVVYKQLRISTVVTASTTEFTVERRPGIRKVTEIPVEELEDFVLKTTPHFSRVFGSRSPGDPHTFSGSGGPDLNQVTDNPALAKFLEVVAKIATNAGITALSDRVSVTFGQGLAQDELTYIYSILKKTMIE
ncbi:hypothetical protein ACFL27_23630 [candidate division CSSED10-310 bacterium]|uniref:Uncharacterized protein n=1 Tax=candidate division CSSED10-310 bacterium TaxID=2855610 RepID=A0ABV6Z434_UNCC1